MVDISMSESSWSWNNSSSSHRIVGRLDRILMNQEWVNLYPNVFAEYLLALSSNHSSLLLSLQKTPPLGLRPFRFLNRWCSEEGFLDTVCQGWIITVAGNPLLKFVIEVKKLLKMECEKLSNQQTEI